MTLPEIFQDHPKDEEYDDDDSGLGDSPPLTPGSFCDSTGKSFMIRFRN